MHLLESAALRAAPNAVDAVKQVIKGFAVCTRGEALGHDLWLDLEALRQVVAAGNANPDGVKAHYTHEHTHAADDLSDYLGRVRNFRLDGDVVRADLHLVDAASKGPRGDLAGHVMRLAQEDPKAFGASMVFGRDWDAEQSFIAKHSHGGFQRRGGGIGAFKSPDPLNTDDLRHARLAKLYTIDVVGQPAANPAGLFSAGHAELVTALQAQQDPQWQQRYEALADAFPGQFEFVIGQCNKGATISEANVAWQALRKAEAHAYAKEHGCTLTAAYSALSTADREKEKQYGGTWAKLRALEPQLAAWKYAVANRCSITAAYSAISRQNQIAGR